LIIGNNPGKIRSEGRDALKEDLKMSYGYVRSSWNGFMRASAVSIAWII
jgi:hypothetical protein